MTDLTTKDLYCFQWFKDTNLRANHNRLWQSRDCWSIVFNGSKILIWEQITTKPYLLIDRYYCFQWFKDTNLRANHNGVQRFYQLRRIVFNGSKILIWEQITTIYQSHRLVYYCFQWFKDTNLRANHNFGLPVKRVYKIVFNGSKILIWEQITTIASAVFPPARLFSMVQRY